LEAVVELRDKSKAGRSAGLTPRSCDRLLLGAGAATGVTPGVARRARAGTPPGGSPTVISTCQGGEDRAFPISRCDGDGRTWPEQGNVPVAIPGTVRLFGEHISLV
jgi:hypothetical protein